MSVLGSESPAVEDSPPSPERRAGCNRKGSQVDKWRTIGLHYRFWCFRNRRVRKSQRGKLSRDKFSPSNSECLLTDATAPVLSSASGRAHSGEKIAPGSAR